MAEVVFLTGVDDKLAFACRLLRKKYREGGRVAVFGPTPLLARLDQALWTQDDLEFLPHLRPRPQAALTLEALARTPIWLLEAADPRLRCESAVNLGIDDVDLLLQHERVAEIIAGGEEDRLAGQQRWKRYKALGHSLLHRPQDASAGRQDANA